MSLRRPLSNVQRSRGLTAGWVSAAFAGAIGAGICAVVLSVSFNVPALGRSAQEDQEDAQIARSLATMLQASRTVISKAQDRINDPNGGDKGIDGKMVLAQASALYHGATETNPAAIDPNSLHGRLIRMQMDSIAEVMDVHQETINRQGVGFKGFIPAVFSRLVNEAFGRRAKGVAAMKVTAPSHLLRNPQVKPDEWELDAIATKLQSPSWPKDQPYSAAAPADGALAERTVFPEYYGSSCLACHGSPKGEIDITGFPKEGAGEGDLAGVISITIYR